jgi:hypothetical protein
MRLILFILAAFVVRADIASNTIYTVDKTKVKPNEESITYVANTNF